ncbi:MAG: hypothetical protein FWD91_06195 [Treponema sp.]|nr:hypothetical protein [Treponema sp.]
MANPPLADLLGSFALQNSTPERVAAGGGTTKCNRFPLPLVLPAVCR